LNIEVSLELGGQVPTPVSQGSVKTYESVC
jgi:hypothetical protein